MTVPAILLIGNANVDLVLGEVDGWPAIGTEVVVERSEMRAGGSAGNSSLALTGMGVAHRYITSVGNDPNGDWLRGQFDPACCDWIVDEGATTVTVGIVHRGGDRVFFTTPGHLQRAGLNDLLARTPPAPRAGACALISGGFLMPEIMAGTRTLLEALHERGWQSAIDPGWPPTGWTDRTKAAFADWLSLASYALINGEEIKAFTDQPSVETAARHLARNLRTDQVLVVKDGPEGAWAFTSQQYWHATSPKVTVIDTVGAGDTFNAAFLSSITSGALVPEALEAGVATAARAISTFPRRYS